MYNSQEVDNEEDSYYYQSRDQISEHLPDFGGNLHYQNHLVSELQRMSDFMEATILRSNNMKAELSQAKSFITKVI